MMRTSNLIISFFIVVLVIDTTIANNRLIIPTVVDSDTKRITIKQQKTNQAKPEIQYANSQNLSEYRLADNDFDAQEELEQLEKKEMISEDNEIEQFNREFPNDKLEQFARQVLEESQSTSNLKKSAKKAAAQATTAFINISSWLSDTEKAIKGKSFANLTTPMLAEFHHELIKKSRLILCGSKRILKTSLSQAYSVGQSAEKLIEKTDDFKLPMSIQNIFEKSFIDIEKDAAVKPIRQTKSDLSKNWYNKIQDQKLNKKINKIADKAFVRIDKWIQTIKNKWQNQTKLNSKDKNLDLLYFIPNLLGKTQSDFLTALIKSYSLGDDDSMLP